MAIPPVSAESKRFADRAIIDSLIGMLRMAAEAGNPSVFRIQYHADGELRSSPYAVYFDDDEDRLTILTAQPGQETLAIPKTSIASVKLVPTDEIVRGLNALGPWLHLARVGQAMIAYLLESQRQWTRALSTLQGNNPCNHP
jgi:hypothetical protein